MRASGGDDAALVRPSAPAAEVDQDWPRISGWRRRLVGVAWAVLGVAVLAHLAYTSFGVGRGELDALFTVWIYNGIQIVAALACLARAVAVKRERAAWGLVGMALLLWVAGDVSYSLLYQHAASVPIPSVSDGLFLAAYPAMFAALVLLIRARVGAFDRVLLLDGALAALALATLASTFVWPQIVATAGDDLGTLLTQVAYPLADMLLAGTVIGVAALAGWRPDRGWMTIGAAFLTTAVADSLYTFAVAVDSYQDGGFLDWLFSLAVALFAVAAWQRPVRRRYEIPAGRPALIVPLALTCVALAVLVADRFVHVPLVAIVLATLTLLAGMARALIGYALARALAQSRRDALTDALTGIGNRTLLVERIEQALRRARRRGGSVALLFLDLDDFKRVNDSLGHEQGDLLLVAVAQRISDCLREEDTVARLGGDEFAVLLEDVAEPVAACRAAERVIAALQRPVIVQERALPTAASVGIAIAGAADGSPAQFLRDADIAMYAAKQDGKNRYRLFEHAMHVDMTQRLELEAALRRAVESDEFRLRFQPIVDLAGGGVCGVEALLRWQHPERGIVPPSEFIPLAEQTGLIVPIGQWVVAEAARQLRGLDERLPNVAPLGLSVNLSAREFERPELVAELERALADAGLDPRRLTVEITESMLVRDIADARVRLRELKRLGVRVALDDFGTGYSSLRYLRELPIDVLKLDKVFVTDIDVSSADRSRLAQAILALADALGLTSVAEGIERPAQAEMLRGLGCDWGQGFHFARPLPIEDLAAWLSARHTEAGEPIPIGPGRAPEAQSPASPARYDEEPFSTVVAALPIWWWLADERGQCVSASDELLRFAGLSRSQVLGEGWLRAVHPEDRDGVRRGIADAFRRRAVHRAEFRLVAADGRYHWISDVAQPRYHRDGTFAGYAGWATDVTAHREAQASLRRREAVLEALAAAGHQLRRSGDVDRSAPEALARLGHASGADRAYVFQADGAERRGSDSRRYVWSAPGAGRERDGLGLQDLPWEGFERWRQAFRNGEPVHGRVVDFPVPERPALEARGVESLAVVPVTAHGELWGLFGFDDCHAGRTWSETELRTLKLAADAFGAAIERAESSNGHP